MKVFKPRRRKPKAPVNEVIRESRKAERGAVPDKIKEVQEILKAVYQMNEAETQEDASAKVVKKAGRSARNSFSSMRLSDGSTRFLLHL
jgi:hypothetical protein